MHSKWLQNANKSCLWATSSFVFTRCSIKSMYYIYVRRPPSFSKPWKASVVWVKVSADTWCWSASLNPQKSCSLPYQIKIMSTSQAVVEIKERCNPLSCQVKTVTHSRCWGNVRWSHMGIASEGSKPDSRGGAIVPRLTTPSIYPLSVSEPPLPVVVRPHLS